MLRRQRDQCRSCCGVHKHNSAGASAADSSEVQFRGQRGKSLQRREGRGKGGLLSYCRALRSSPFSPTSRGIGCSSNIRFLIDRPLHVTSIGQCNPELRKHFALTTRRLRELKHNEMGVGKATIYFAMIGMFLRPIHRVESVRQSAVSAA